MKLSQVRNLIAVADRGSLRAASRHLGIGQPAMTRSIQDLEAELGGALLMRTSKGAELTALGQAFVQRASAAQHELERARIEIRQLTGKEAGRVKIGLATAPHMAFLPKVLPAFHRRYPDVRVDVIEGRLPAMERRLFDHEIDFYVGPSHEGWRQPGFAVETLHGNLRLVFARPGHPLAGARSLKDLVGARWVSTTVTLDDETEIAPVFENRGLPRPVIAASAHSAMSLVMIAASTDLLALMPQQLILLSNTTGLVRPIRIEDEIAAPDICIIKRSELPLTATAEFLADLFRRASLNQPNYLQGSPILPLP